MTQRTSTHATDKGGDAELKYLLHQLEDHAIAELEPFLSDEEMDRRVERSGKVADKMIATDASDLVGLAAKARAAAWCWGTVEDFRMATAQGLDTTYECAAHSIISDLLRLGRQTDDPSVQADPTDASPTMRAAAAAVLSAREVSRAALERTNAADERAEALHPEAPELIRNPQHPRFSHMRPQLEEMDRRAASLTWPQSTATPRVDAYDRWHAQIDAIDLACGATEADEGWQEACRQEQEAVDRVLDQPCRTMGDAVLKYAIMLACDADPRRREIDNPAPFFRFLSDLQGLNRATSN